MAQKILIFMIVFQLHSMALAECMPGCRCDNTLLMVTCNTSELDKLPITLNPHITYLIIRNSQIEKVDDGFQFYEALVILDLSRNKIATVQDGAFISQVVLMPTDNFYLCLSSGLPGHPLDGPQPPLHGDSQHSLWPVQAALPLSQPQLPGAPAPWLGQALP